MAKITLEKKMKSAGDKWKETPLPLDAYTTLDEAVKAGHFASERALVAAAYRDRGVRVDRVLRPAIEENANISVGDLTKLANAFKYPEPGTRTTSNAGPKTKVKKEARAKARSTVREIPVEKIRGLGVGVARSFVALGSLTPAQFEAAFPGEKALADGDVEVVETKKKENGNTNPAAPAQATTTATAGKKK